MQKCAVPLDDNFDGPTMKQHIFEHFHWIIKGSAEKVLQFLMPISSIYNKNFGFVKSAFLKTTESLK
jgi:hypothetical protein